MSKYTADAIYNKNTDHFYGSGYLDEKWAKTYTFYLKPRFDTEKEINLVIWVIDDLKKATEIGLDKEGANSLSGSRSAYVSTTAKVPEGQIPIDKNAWACAAFFSLPTLNPKDGTKLEASNFDGFDPTKKPDDPNMAFQSGSLFEIQDRFVLGDEKTGTDLGRKSPTNIDEYIEYLMYSARVAYARSIYKVSMTAVEDLKKLDLPENKVEFSQKKQDPPATTSSLPSDARWVDSIPDVVKISGDFKFNVEKTDIFVMVGTGGSFSVAGDLTIITEPTDWVFDNSINPDDELDGEYIEANVVIDGEEDPVLTEIVNPDAALQMMEQRDAEEHQSTETGGTNVQMPGGGSMTGRVNTTYEVNGPSWGKVKKGMDNASLLRAMVSYIEGGYYYPGHAYSKFSAKDRNLYGSSGETLWGIDRHAGQTEATSEGKLFWAEVDKLSGYGNTTGKSGYARKTATRDWNSSSYPTKSSGWSYNYSPKPGSTGYDIMYNSFVKYATSHLESYLNTYFKSHPVKSLILSDSRLKFLWFRSTWNGIGWFSWYATGKKKKGINGLMWAYDNVTKNPDELIIWDLNNRLKFNNGLITHDVKKMSALLGIKPGGGLA